MSPQPLVAGNWKMNGLRAELAEFDAVARALPAVGAGSGGVEVMIAPPATLLPLARASTRGRLALGAQDCHSSQSGAYTGDIAAGMIAECGARYVIVGHSERRAGHGETDVAVAAKAIAAHGAGLTAIICVGETEAERDGGQTLDVIARQLSGSIPAGAAPHNTVIAYEPVWAIGTGRTPTGNEIANVHAAIRDRVSGQIGAEAAAATRILYGGSVKPGNAVEIARMPHVDGALVGGASLKATDFLAIIAGFSG